MRLFRWIFVVSLLLVSSGVRAQTRLTRNGKPAARIVVAQQTAADLTAAQLLQRFVRESTGATLPLLHDVTPRKGDILIGFRTPRDLPRTASAFARRKACCASAAVATRGRFTAS